MTKIKMFALPENKKVLKDNDEGCGKRLKEPAWQYSASQTGAIYHQNI